MNETITEAEFLLESLAPVPYQDTCTPSSSCPTPKKMPPRRLAAAFEASDYYTKNEDAIQFYKEVSQF